MLALRDLPPEYAEFNRAHRAPDGHAWKRWLRHGGRLHPSFLRRIGPYGWQTNNSIRAFEYPWAFAQIRALGDGLRVVDIGAGLGGLQFTLAEAGYEVHAVDPGMAARGRGWELDPERHRQLGRAFAPVTLHATTLREAGLPDGTADVVLSVSTIEHFAPQDLSEFAEDARRVLKPGGHLVLTIDLFLDLQPFSDRERNEYGTNIDVRQLLDAIGADLVVGHGADLHGFPDFDPRSVLGRLDRIAVGTGHPALAQCLVARLR